MKKVVVWLVMMMSVLLMACQSKSGVISHTECEKAVSVSLETGVVFRPHSGASYAHHPFITQFKGEFYAVFSCGTCNEDDFGQCVMISHSTDGLNWSNPVPLVRPINVGNGNGVLTPSGLYSTKDTLVVYFGYYYYDPQSCVGNARPTTDTAHMDTSCFAISTQNGTDWSKPQNMNMAFVGNSGPFKTQSGRLILCGNVAFPYSDDLSGLGEFTMTGIYGDSFAESSVLDDSASIHQVKDHENWEYLLCEGSCIQLKNKTLRMFLRSSGRNLFCSESKDNGLSWSEPFETQFEADSSKFCMGKLSNGRYFFVGNAMNNGYRVPLYLYTSKDGTYFDKGYVLCDDLPDQQYTGLYKGGFYAYPSVYADKNYVYIIYSLHKEQIEVVRVAMKDLK